MADLGLVRRYREQILAHDTDNPITLSTVAEVLDRQREKAWPKTMPSGSYQLSAQRAGSRSCGVDSKRWPEIREA
jgi:hypothetical protein